jgi:hypothetical protein
MSRVEEKNSKRQTNSKITRPLIVAIALAICLLLAITASSPTHVTAQSGSPSNDTCSGAIPLALNIPVTGTTVNALDDYRLSGSACFSGVGQTASTVTGRDVVYSFIAPTADTYSIRVTGYTSSANLVLYATNSCPSGAPPVTINGCLLAANRSTDRAEEVFCLPLTANQQIFIFVDENSISANGGNFTIEANRCRLEDEGHNNDSVNATQSGFQVVGCPVEGVIFGAGDVDYYLAGLPTDVDNSRLFALVDGVAANDTDFDMRINNSFSLDTLQYSDRDNDQEFGEFSPNIAGTRLTDPLTVVRVNHHDPGKAAGPYRLYQLKQPPLSGARRTGWIERHYRRG